MLDDMTEEETKEFWQQALASYARFRFLRAFVESIFEMNDITKIKEDAKKALKEVVMVR